MPRSLAKNRGSMLVTAIFVIVVFTSLLAIISRILMRQEDVELGNVYSTQAEALARSGTEFALGALFLPNKLSVDSPIFKEGIKEQEYIILQCPSEHNTFCNVQGRCNIEKVTIIVRNLAKITSDTDILYEYQILSRASCTVPFINNTNSYKITREIQTVASDLRWQ